MRPSVEHRSQQTLDQRAPQPGADTHAHVESKACHRRSIEGPLAHRGHTGLGSNQRGQLARGGGVAARVFEQYGLVGTDRGADAFELGVFLGTDPPVKYWKASK